MRDAWLCSPIWPVSPERGRRLLQPATALPGRAVGGHDKSYNSRTCPLSETPFGVVEPVPHRQPRYPGGFPGCSRCCCLIHGSASIRSRSPRMQSPFVFRPLPYRALSPLRSTGQSSPQPLNALCPLFAHPEPACPAAPMRLTALLPHGGLSAPGLLRAVP